jgi:macrolide-specific efflux system membrane fusion protein
MFTTHLLMTLALVLAPKGTASGESTGHDAIILDCEVSSIEDQPVPSSDAGVLVKVTVKEGTRVTKDTEVARVDDREAQAQLVVKQKDYEVAKQEADSKVNIRFNKVTAEVAQKAFEKLEEANRGQSRAVSQIEVLRAELEWKKAVLGIEKATQENTSNKLAADAKQAEVDAAQVGVDRRILRAPFDGYVNKVYRHVGEWVSPGDPVMQIVRVDRLRVSGNLDAAEWGPGDVEGRKVTVDVFLPRGGREKVAGRIVYVSPVVEGGQLPVTAEIESPMENGRPLVRAGLKANMTIHVGSELAEAEPRPLPGPIKTRDKN